MLIALTILLYILNYSTSQAINEFTTNQEINYQFDNSGQVNVEHKISIINNFSQFYPKVYNLTLSGSQANDIQAYDNFGTISTDITNNSDQVKLSLKLQNAKTGKDQITSLNIHYHSSNLAKKKGKTWEISLPQFEDNLSNNISLNLVVPTIYGKLSSSPPGATISNNTQNTTIFFKNYDGHDKLILTFGEYQLFNFDLKYFIKNDTDNNGFYTIPVPPDTSNQKIYFNSINPTPTKIESDTDGNWLAFYLLAPKSGANITVTGQAKIGQNPNYNFVATPIFDNQLYWDTNNPEISSLAQKYTTPRQIYDYVVSTLSYDFTRVNDSNRKGSLFAIQNPSNALCTDFTDLFISIARASNFGAREIEGYAYSNNTNIKPISLGTDVLHAWPEYYNSKTQKWIAIDPTWAKTTGGINYFDDLDLNHFTFVIHNSKSDSPPPPGSYKNDQNEKSVDISFAESEIIVDTKNPIITSKFNPFSQSFLIIKNPNLFALDKFSLQNSAPQNLLPLAEIKIDFPKVPFFNTLSTSKQNITLSYSYNDLPSQTINIQNPYHFFNLFIIIIVSLILLSFGAIILLRHK